MGMDIADQLGHQACVAGAGMIQVDTVIAVPVKAGQKLMDQGLLQKIPSGNRGQGSRTDGCACTWGLGRPVSSMPVRQGKETGLDPGRA